MNNIGTSALNILIAYIDNELADKNRECSDFRYWELQELKTKLEKRLNDLYEGKE
jgi:hypothetical protein